ncbi:MAG: GYF domain-containing protein, partial [Bacteroidia bacterium]
MKKYFLHNGKDQDGPYSVDDLKLKGLTAKTMVWFEGISTW